MKTRNALWIAVVAAVLMATDQAHAIATITGSDRYVEVSDGTVGVQVPSLTLEGSFVDSVDFGGTPDISASQNSDIASLLITGTGNATHNEGGPTNPGFARSLFEVEFDLAEAHNFSLTGSLGIAEDPGPAFAVLSLHIPGDAIIFNFGAPSTTSLDESGMLMAGSYVLTAVATAGDNENILDALASAQFEFEFILMEKANAVPEPITATLGLMGLGVLGMATRRRVA